MKIKSLFLISILNLTSVFAIDLTAATNQQLLDEVARRMGGSNPGTSAIASFVCDSSYLRVSVVGVTNKTDFSLYQGDSARCNEQAAVLNKYKSKVYGLTIAAICDSSYLRRYKFLPEGTSTELDSTYMGDYAKCFAQAKQMNEN